MEPIFYQFAGIMAIGSRLRRFTDIVSMDSAGIYEMQGITFEPRWFPVFYMLDKEGPSTVGDLAEHIGQSHASVSQVAKEMQKAGLLQRIKDKSDGRKSMLSLTTAAEPVSERMNDFYADVYNGVAELLSESKHDFWTALQDLEAALQHKSIKQRVHEQRKLREAEAVEIIDYTPEYAQAFRDINVEWIGQYFVMEDADYQALDHPQTYILDSGGHILVALYNGVPLGVVAMIKIDDQSYELAKMGVRPTAQGKGIGYLLGEAVKQKAKTLGAKRLYLESNTKLQPAIRLYYKLGFEKLAGHVPTPYARSNIQMELWLD